MGWDGWGLSSVLGPGNPQCWLGHRGSSNGKGSHCRFPPMAGSVLYATEWWLGTCRYIYRPSANRRQDLIKMYVGRGWEAPGFWLCSAWYVPSIQSLLHKPQTSLPVYLPPSFPFPKSRISLISCSSGFPQIYAQMILLVFPSPCGPGCGSARANTGSPLLSSLWLGYPFLEASMTKQTVQRGEGNAPCVPKHIILSTSEMPWYSTKCSMTSRDCGYWTCLKCQKQSLKTVFG